MKIEGKKYRTIWFENNIVKIIDQTKLPHKFIIKELKTVKDAINAIKTMEVREHDWCYGKSMVSTGQLLKKMTYLI